MHLSELKAQHVSELIKMGEELEIENVARLRKQELMFAIMKKRAKGGEQVFGDGVLEVLPDGFGFLRSIEASYMACTDDIYLSPSQIRRFNLHTGDMVEGEVRVPKDGERYFALVKVDRVNGLTPEESKHKIMFENLTPLFPKEQFKLERDDQERREHHQPHHRPDRADRQRPARAAGRAAQDRQDGDDAAPGARARRQPPRGAPDRAAGRRAARGSDRDGAHGARRGHQLDLRRARRAPRAGGRDGDRARQAPGRAEEGRGDPARLDHPPGAGLQQRAALLPARC